MKKYQGTINQKDQRTSNKYQRTFLPPAYGVRREGYVLTCVCLSVTGGGQVQPGGRSRRGRSGPAGGVSGPAGGGLDSRGGSASGGGSTTRRAVCLLRSRRRTFLLHTLSLSFGLNEPQSAEWRQFRTSINNGFKSFSRPLTDNQEKQPCITLRQHPELSLFN